MTMVITFTVAISIMTSIIIGLIVSMPLLLVKASLPPTASSSIEPSSVPTAASPGSYAASIISYDDTTNGTAFTAGLFIIRSVLSVVHHHHNNFYYSYYWSHGCSFYHL